MRLFLYDDGRMKEVKTELGIKFGTLAYDLFSLHIAKNACLYLILESNTSYCLTQFSNA